MSLQTPRIRPYFSSFSHLVRYRKRLDVSILNFALVRFLLSSDTGTKFKLALVKDRWKFYLAQLTPYRHKISCFFFVFFLFFFFFNKLKWSNIDGKKMVGERNPLLSAIRKKHIVFRYILNRVYSTIFVHFGD